MNWRLRVFSATDNRLFLVGQSPPVIAPVLVISAVFPQAAIPPAVFREASSIDS